MTESTLKISEIKLALKRKGLKFKVKSCEIDDSAEESLVFVDIQTGTQVCGKIVRSFTEGEVYHWPLLNHLNLAPLIDVLYIRNDLNIFLTTDFHITLKNIIHDEDFVYDPRCFDRKKKYAKGIFSGLSYLHGKSLCLMNLCDDNIVISKAHDTAILTNFKYLICSQKVTKSKLNVADVYKAPEVEKIEFDAMGAEMWASGTLMLDMFLAHMVPWAVADYKPKRVVDIINKVSLELLQAANAGSIVSTIDLAKFKTFLKCFFKQNPSMRVSAKYASIASFLRPKLQDSFIQIDAFAESEYKKAKNPAQEVTDRFTSNGFQCNFKGITKQIPNKQLISKNYDETFIPTNYINSEPCRVINMNLQEKHTSKYLNSAISIPVSTEIREGQNEDNDIDRNSLAVKSGHLKKEGKFREIMDEDEVAISQAKTSINLTNQQSGDNLDPLPFFYRSQDCFTIAETPFDPQKISKSCQMIKQEANDFTESSFPCYQSSSLSFIKSRKDNDNNNNKKAMSYQFYSKRTRSVSNIKFLSVKQSSVPDYQNSDLYLNRLFGDSDSTAEPKNLNIQTAEKSLDIPRTRDLQNRIQAKERVPYNSEYHFPRQIIVKPTKPPRFSKPLNIPSLLNETEVREIINRILFLKKCHIFIQMHLHMTIFVSKEFSGKQRRLLSEYHNLLHQENIRLWDILRMKYKLGTEDIIRLIRLLNARPKHFMNHNGKQSQIPKLSKFRENRFLEIKKEKNGMKDVESNVKIHSENKFNDKNISLKVKPLRRYSYFRAIEMTEKHLDKKWELGKWDNEPSTKKGHENTVFVLENKSSDNLIETTMKRDKKTNELDVDMELENTVIRKGERDLITTTHDDENGIYEKSPKHKKKGKNEKERTEKNAKKKKSSKKEKNKKQETNDKKLSDLKKLEEKNKRSFFFSMCPGGKVDEPTPVLSSLCEACKLNLEAM